ncbi:F-box/FBD/LRR-repeat protein [Melia azedarach]|uniref:F-box/FBD/LRR-repeat protein n=1 Tax=Melia azedarach TaxID=155640 RepID=A0ACC1X770_MELAZ|nr:F-box/FBD/LRR-repeat protein [Melia azedarach]
MSKRRRVGDHLDDQYLRSVDRISNLPWHILDDILGRLPIKDAVRTTILSKQWRNKWFDLSKLHFDDSSLSRRGGCKLADVNLLVNLVYHVLLCHRGPIHTFSLSTFYQPRFSDLDYWISFISRKNIKELAFGLSIGFNTIDEYVIPPSLFSCQQLTHLHLKNATLFPPYTFPGFRNLVSLRLNNYTNYHDELTNLIRKCPVLERVELDNFQNYFCLKIEALKLKYLLLNGILGVIVLKNCPVLADVSMIMVSGFFPMCSFQRRRDPPPFLLLLGSSSQSEEPYITWILPEDSQVTTWAPASSLPCVKVQS